MNLIHLSITENKKSGFTLMELLVVVAIIAILFIAVAMVAQTSIRRARVGKAQADLNRIGKAVRQYELDTERTLHDKLSLSVCPPNSTYVTLILVPNAPWNPIIFSNDTAGEVVWNGPYMEEVPFDPWGGSYNYAETYFCQSETIGCEGYENKEIRALLSVGPDRSSDPSSFPSESKKDDVVLRLFTCPDP